jgi:HD-like signal output (HDOD) protein
MTTIPNSTHGQVTAEIIAEALGYPPSAPKVLPLLKRYLMDLNAPIDQITDLIRLDPGISARVLQAANCALYARGERCHSVAFAVNRIGFGNIYEMVANAVAEQVLVRPLVAYSLEADEFWRRSVACGLAAERVAELCGEDRNVAYTLGLLSGVGMVAIDHWVQRHQPNIGFFSRGFPRDYTDGERVLLGCTHAEVGSAVLRGWEFPSEMSEPLRWQYKPTDVLTHRRLNCVLYAAKWLASSMCAEPSERTARVDNRLLMPIRLTESQLAEHLPGLSAKLDLVQRSLEVDSPGEAA